MKAIIITIFILWSQLIFAQAPVQIPTFSFTEVYSNKVFTANDLPKEGFVIFNFYDTGCSHCQKMGASIAKNLSLFKNVKFYFVSMNDKVYVDGFIDMFAKGLKSTKQVTFLFDKNAEFIQKFNPTQTPSIYLYDAKSKKLIKHFEGVENAQKIAAELPKT